MPNIRGARSKAWVQQAAGAEATNSWQNQRKIKKFHNFYEGKGAITLTPAAPVLPAPLQIMESGIKYPWYSFKNQSGPKLQVDTTAEFFEPQLLITFSFYFFADLLTAVLQCNILFLG